MMMNILAAFHLDDPASLKRALAAAFGGLVLLLSPFLQSKGVPVPSESAQMAVAGLIATFIAQSAYKSAAAINAAAVSNVTNMGAANVILDAAGPAAPVVAPAAPAVDNVAKP